MAKGFLPNAAELCAGGRRGISLHHLAADAQHCIAGDGPCSETRGCSQLISCKFNRVGGWLSTDSSPLDVYLSPSSL